MRNLVVAAVLAAMLPAQPEPPRVVFVVGEREYGSDETMPAFAARLQNELKLRVTVLASEGDQQLPPLDALDSADLLVLYLRFRRATPGQLARLSRWFDEGRPCVALRTTSHAFVEEKGWFPPLFGGHYKAHAPNRQGTRSFVIPGVAGHPIVRGLRTSVAMGHGGTYNAQPLANSATALLLGRTGRLPAEPIAWINRYRPESRIFYTSLGSRENFEREDFQRLLANAVLWCLGREVPADSAFGGGAPAVRPAAAVPEPGPPPALRAPAGATVLFDGRDAAAFRHWDPSVEPRAIGIDRRADTSAGGPTYDAARWRIEDGALVARPGFGDVVTRESFGDYHLHVDFLVPRETAPDAFRGQSGVFLAGRYEIQIADSLGSKKVDEYACGAIYGQSPPARDAAGPPGTWQSLDVHFRWLQDRHPVVSAWLNGEPIHDRVTLQERTTYGFRGEPAGARSVARGNGLRHARAASESFRFAGGRFAIAARFRTAGNGTIAAKAPPSGPWKPNGKTLFLRGGRLVYDIGWVGQMQSRRRYDDGRWHRALLTHDGREALLFVDGEEVAAREDFTAPDEPGHVFKIGTTSPDFGGAFTGEISDVTVFEHRVPTDKAVQWTRGEVVDMGRPSFEWAPDAEPATAAPERPTVVSAPIRLQADSSPVRFANIWLQPLADVDHRRWIGRRDAATLAQGERLYAALCSECHARPRTEWPNGLARGSNPRALFSTLEDGYAGKAAMAWIPPEPRYAIIHHVRDDLGLPPVSADYLAALPPGFGAGATAPRAPDDGDWPAWRRMDYGDALHWTYEVADDNIAQKGIAVRLDPGAGGVSRGRAFMVYDHDTMRVAAAWTGDGFIDWKGVAFDGSHNSHARVVGETAFVNPVGPGWAEPATGSFDDPRLVGRDGRRFGPLPREWSRYRGRELVAGRNVIVYDVGDATVREIPGFEEVHGLSVFTRTLCIEGGSREHRLRVAPAATTVTLQLHPASQRPAELLTVDGFHVLRVPADPGTLRATVCVTNGDRRLLALRTPAAADAADALFDATPGSRQAAEPVTVSVLRGDEDGAFSVDTIPLPDGAQNPHRSWLRLGGFDFFADGTRAAVSTWNGDVWLVSGIGPEMQEVHWRRVAAGLFQPLGVRIVDGAVHVGCRDQIVVLEDEDGDGVTDRYRCFNNDHQVTEHFHEFAMGLQTDAAGNFYYCKSARHAKTALVPHHGTLLKVSADGGTTEIVANGFRAANGVCVNGDGTFYVTDQEGHWTPKNRINRVVPGGFYGNMMGYHDRESSADADMQQPLCWITNAFDRSPAELVRVAGDAWGLPAGSLLQLSYGMGRIFLVLEDAASGVHQGGMVALPIEPFPTGIMRGRFHPRSGQLYCCGLYGWSGARTRPGGLYRVRYTGVRHDGGGVPMPVGMRAVEGGIELRFGVELDPETAGDPDSYALKTWQLRRSKRYGSEHHDTRDLAVARAVLLADRRTVRLGVPELAPTMCIEIRCNVETPDERVLRPVIHGTLHAVR